MECGFTNEGATAEDERCGGGEAVIMFAPT